MTGTKSSRLARCREAGPRTSPGATDRKLQRLPGPGLPDPWDAPLREVHPLPAQRCDPAPAHADMDADQQEAADRRFDVARPPTRQDFGRAQMHRRRPRSPPPPPASAASTSTPRLDLDRIAQPLVLDPAPTVGRAQHRVCPVGGRPPVLATDAVERPFPVTVSSRHPSRSERLNRTLCRRTSRCCRHGWDRPPCRPRRHARGPPSTSAQLSLHRR